MRIVIDSGALDQQRLGAKSIALAIFRFRARRGVGAFYSLLSIIPLLTYFLNSLSVSHYVSQIFLGVCLLLIWLFSRIAGFTGFLRMTQTISLVNIGSGSKIPRIVSKGVTWNLMRVLPLIAPIISDIFHMSILAEAFLFGGVFALLFYYILAYSMRSYDSIMRRRVEDYAVIVATIVVLFLQFLPFISPEVSFALLSPVLLLAGVKSMYEAPEELVQAF